MAESAKRHEENSNIIKEIRASTDALQLKKSRGCQLDLEIQIGQMSKVLQKRGIRSLRLHGYSYDDWKEAPFLDLGASVSVMPFSTYTNLDLGDLAHTRLTIELTNRTIKHPRGITENVLFRIGKFIFPIDFIILDIPEDNDVPLILVRPFLSTAHAKIDVFKRKITLRVGEEKLVFKSIKPATSIIRRVYMLKDGTNLDSKTELIRDAVNESFDPHCGNYIELNDLNVPLEPRMDQDNNFEPTLDENIIVNEPAFKSYIPYSVSNLYGYADAIRRILGFGIWRIDYPYRPCCKEIDDLEYSEKDMY
ncbi:DUF4219 domain-containing protein [Tanacetum coccineum]